MAGLGFFASAVHIAGGGGATPTVQAVGTPVEGLGNVTPGLPTHQANDILCVYAENGGNESAIATPTTGGVAWAAVADAPVSGGANGTDSNLNLWWVRASGAGTTDPVLVDPGNHIIAVALVFRGCTTSGNPWDVTAPSTGASSTTASVAGDTTTVNNCLVIGAVATGVDAGADGSAQFSGHTNSDLTSLTELVDIQRTIGNGGNLGIFSGEKATAGAFGTTTVTLANASTKAMHVMALKP